ncbi:TPA: hypothetical protein QCI11_002955 [Enterobacter ludwigii]|uniref:hypothetical protein n=1 Tax=Enterobacter ludwigii TaxID=299767 RepID=UPI002026798D|nr:hypothetical protein [Enterobacter ludwigii]HDR2537626.1 hypothetical protein [Enterobacter ludwigii]
MITFTKEQLIASAHARIEFAEMMLAGELEPLKERTWSIELELARIALASLEAEPVAWRYRTTDIKGNPLPDWGFSEEDSLLGLYQPLYTAPPAPVSVPDERYQHLSELYHAMEKRLFKLAQRIKGSSFDKYAHSTSQAIDVLESVIFGESASEDSRAAMLQGADDNSPVIPDDLIRRIAFSLVYLAADEKLRSDEGSLFALVRQGIDVVRRELAAPQQEVKQALAKGMERYGDAMQELAKKEVKR